MEEVLKRIGSLRKKKGISHEAMALDLNLSQAAYSKIEKGDTKLALERLYQIAGILEVGVEELLGIDSRYNQEVKENQHFTVIAHQEVENLHQENKETMNRLIQSLNQQIEFLKEENRFLREQFK